MSEKRLWEHETARTPAGWTHEAMRDAVQDARRVQREMEQDGYSSGGPTDAVLASMLEQVLDDLALGGMVEWRR